MRLFIQSKNQEHENFKKFIGKRPLNTGLCSVPMRSELVFFFQNNQKCYSESIIIVPRFLKESVFTFLAFLEEKQNIKIAS